MEAVSDTFLASLRYGHNLFTEATIIPPVGAPITLTINDGTVTVDRTADHRRELELVIADPSVYPMRVTDPVNVSGSEVVVKRGITLSTGDVEMAQLGVFRVESLERTLSAGKKTVTLTGWDRSMQVADQRFRNPRRFNAQTGVTLIQLLITEVYPDAVFHVLTTDTTNIKKHHVDRDRWEEVQRVAAVCGLEVYADTNGEWVIQDIPDITTAMPVWIVDAGPGGVLVSASDTVSREGVPSVVVALGESVSGDDPPVISASPHGYDNDPLSPTYYLGAYGLVPRFFSSPLLRTQAQADKAADKQLANHKGATRTISFEAVPNPALDAGDAVQVVYPDRSGELHLLDALTIPLGPGGTMSSETRAVDWVAE